MSRMQHEDNDNDEFILLSVINRKEMPGKCFLWNNLCQLLNVGGYTHINIDF